MRWNALLQPIFAHEAAVPVQSSHATLHASPAASLQASPTASLQASLQVPRRWLLGWLQLLCAWVLCMLLCANIALVFAEGLSQGTSHARSGKAVGCAATGSPAHAGPQRAERAGPVKGQKPAC